MVNLRLLSFTIILKRNSMKTPHTRESLPVGSPAVQVRCPSMGGHRAPHVGVSARGRSRVLSSGDPDAGLHGVVSVTGPRHLHSTPCLRRGVHLGLQPEGDKKGRKQGELGLRQAPC